MLINRNTVWKGSIKQLNELKTYVVDEIDGCDCDVKFVINGYVIGIAAVEGNEIKVCEVVDGEHFSYWMSEDEEIEIFAQEGLIWMK